MEEGKKYPIIPYNNPMVAGYAIQLDQLINSDDQRIVIEVPRSAILRGDISTVANLLAAAQHKKKWIDALLFGMEFSFLSGRPTGSNFLTFEEWASDPHYQRWFNIMGAKLPF